MERNLYRRSLDTLEYIDLHLSHLNETDPESLSLVKSIALFIMGDIERGKEFLRREREHYPGNKETRLYRDCLEENGTVPEAESILKPDFMRIMKKMIRANRKGGKEHRNAILFINTYYPLFLDDHYRRNPDLSSSSYGDQKDALEGSCFGDSDFYSRGFGQAGWKADDLIVNCLPLQQAWAAGKRFQRTGG